MLALDAMLIAIAAALSYIERIFPIQTVVPIFGLKLGLANVVTLFALFYLPFRHTFAIVVTRCVLGMLLAGSPMSLMYSLGGGLCALFVMLLVKQGHPRIFSLYGISIAGAAAHNLGQVTVSALILGDFSIYAYLPLLLAGGLVTGVLIAIVANLFFKSFDRTKAFQSITYRP